MLAALCTMAASFSTPVAAVEEEEEDDIFARLSGNWSVFWLAGQQPRRTVFVAEISRGIVELREEAPIGVMTSFVDSVVSLFRPSDDESEMPQSQCVSTAWLRDDRHVVSVHYSAVNNGIYLSGCSEEVIPLPSYRTEKNLGLVLEAPRAVYFPVNGVCTPASFTIKGYWVEQLRKNVFLMVLMFHDGTHDCSLVFQFIKQISDKKESFSVLWTFLLLIIVSLVKFIPRFYLKKTGRIIGDKSFVRSQRYVLSEARRNQLIQKQEEIIRRMKEEDGKSQGAI
ncbi:uncharacterized protein TM35_000025310 [Trypanosoma theileri]|uniref:Uncharacterized protein n=1 Tax=Trypanosoma theileri TaxID=67003 RepID=A0A1X0P8Q0_9TRYP|nr:uncharacterized protein TM35_000025310 [Trypanosoma theileri]ORC93205.1 hypothetical protein TM35_000025310 [Trypanosoma theileri]